jgi:hypothetical protein
VGMSLDQMESDEEISDDNSPSGQSSHDTSSDSEGNEPYRKPSKSNNMIYHNVYTNISPEKSERITLPRASRYRIEEMPMAFSVGTGVSYLSAQPCPIKAWVGTMPHPTNPLQDGVTDTGASCIIEEGLVPPNYPIMESPLKPVFQSIGNGQTPARGYVVLPVHLPNAAAMSGDDRHARVAKIWMEFQVVEKCPAGFLIGMDALKAYKWSIDLPAMTITLKGYDPPIRIPITDTKKFSTKKIDPRVFAAEAINIQPFHELWVPVRFAPPDNYSDLMVTPVRHANLAEGTYATCSYAIMSKDTNHLLMVNPTERPFRIRKDEIVGMFEPVVANTPFAYFSSTAVSTLDNSASAVQQASTANWEQSKGAVKVDRRVEVTSVWPGSQDTQPTDSFPNLGPSLKLNDPNLTWHDGVDVPIDPFGLEKEFKETGPLEKSTTTPQAVGEEASGEMEAQRESGEDSNENMNWEPGEKLDWDICPKLNRRERRAWMKMLRKFRKVFAGPEEKLGKVKAKFDMEINADAKAIRSQQPYRTSPRKRELINDAVKTLLELDVIEPSNSPIASPVVVVIQKGKPRFCIDLREVNSKTVADRYALPKQDSIFRALARAIFFSIIDANRGYHQFGLKRGSRYLTAFVTEDGFWQFKRMPFGLKNAPSHFQRAVDTILGTYRFEFALAFIDDIVIFSRSLAEHLMHVGLVLEALEKVGMTVSEKKCHFAYQSVELLGRRVSRLGLSTQEEKVKAIMDLPYPKTIGEASELFGQFNYHRDFIQGFAEMAKPITDGMSPKKTTKKYGASPHRMSPKEYAKMRSNTPFPDNQKIREAFLQLKTALSNAPVLVHPNFEKEFILYTDACRKGIAGALYQMSDDSKEHPILFISRNLTDAETRYSATELECLAVVWTLHKLEHYVDGSKLKLYTDHAALKWIWDVKSTANSRLFKWSLILNPLRDKVTVIHRPGRLHNNVDPLSRYPVVNSVNLLSVNEEWKAKLWRGYLDDAFFRRVLKRLMDHRNKAESKKTSMGLLDGNVESQNERGKEKDKSRQISAQDKSGKRKGKARSIATLENQEKEEETSRQTTAQDKSEKRKQKAKYIAADGNHGKEEDTSRQTAAQDKSEEGKGVQIGRGENPRSGNAKSAQDKSEEKLSHYIEISDDGMEKEMIIDDEVIENQDAQDKSGKRDEKAGKDNQVGNRGIGESDADYVAQDEGGEEKVDSVGRKEMESLLEFYDNIRNKPTTITDGTFSLIENCLFFSERQDSTLRLCIPTNLIQETLHLCHDTRAHPGIRRTYSSVALRFFFPKMSRRIKQHVNDCLECQISKPSHEKPLGLLQSIKSQHPHHTLCLDFITGLPVSQGFDSLLTVTDAYTKAIKLIPCHETTSAEDTAKLFMQHCYPIFGLPAKIISDRDTRFTSKFWATLMQLLDVKLGMTTAYHPQGDGQSEKTNQTVEIALRCLLGGDADRYAKWVEYLPIVEHEYNSTTHDSTGHAPNDLRFAIKPRSLADLLYPLEGASESAEQLAEELKNRQDEARDSIAIAQRKQKRYYDQRHKPHEFEVGDLVILKLNRFGPGYKPTKPHFHKLAPLGKPFRIIEKISPLSYRIDLPTGTRIHNVVSIIHLRKYHGTNDNLRPLPIQIDEEDEYEVERIEGQRTNAQGTTEYLVKWKGYGDHERTWEPFSHLQRADVAVADWHASQPDPPKRTRSDNLPNVTGRVTRSRRRA